MQNLVVFQFFNILIKKNSFYVFEVLNCLSLEVSSTPLGRAVRAPECVRSACWADTVWPQGHEGLVRPQVSKYCILSMAGAVTDFHIDFGGSSVWYHVVEGEKVFYLAEPTKENLEAYEQWSRKEQVGKYMIVIVLLMV